MNFSNHPSEKWDTKQLNEARKYGDIVDIPFPAVDPSVPSDMIREMADWYTDAILSKNPSCVLCQGEFTLCFHVIEKLNRAGVKVVAACSKRIVSEEDNIKLVEFSFECFREY